MTKDQESHQISTVRSFCRTVTRRVGVFTDRFLGRDRPLAEARLIFEIGEPGCDVRDLRSRFGFDSGYLSRLLRSLEGQGLIEVKRHPKDRRVRTVRLTEDGLRELGALNRGGDTFAVDLLQPLSEDQRARLVAAMDTVERLVTLSVIEITREDPESADAQFCLDSYFAELDRRFDDGFRVGHSISANAAEMTLPRGILLVARLDRRPVGCGAVKRLADGVGSVKRMWVDDSVRGVGLGRRLLVALETEARQMGLSLLRLETNKNLAAAQQLYRSSGYREVAPFNNDPYADFWFEKDI